MRRISPSISKTYRFVPQTIEIHVNDTVTWVNDDRTGHTATRTTDPPFNTDLLAKGQTKSIQFTKVSPAQGFDYFCIPHPFMTGRVVVRAANTALGQMEAEGGETTDVKPTTIRAATTVTVHIKDLQFVPETVEIQVGDTITWINDDDDSHTATYLQTSTSDEAFDTGLLTTGQSSSHTFTQTTSGTGKQYFCVPHPFMTGRVVVKLPGSHLAGMRKKHQ